MDEQKQVEKVQELERLSAIGQISAGIAHEIRNPLTAVKGFLQLMQQEHDSRYWDIVNSELEQAISTVQNLLVVSKPEKLDEKWSDVNLCQLLDSILSLFENEMYRVKVEKRFFNVNCQVSGKRNQLKRAFFNLLKNAFEAIEGEGVITVEHYRSGNEVCLHIRDTGKGIPSDMLPLLGTPFFSTKTETGTGLGLAQVYATFDDHKASIDVNSTEQEGTEFIIRMPLLQKPWEEQMKAELVIEENMDVRQFFEVNRQQFNRQLEIEAQNSFEIVSGLKFVTTQDLIDHANQILSLVHDGMTQEIIKLAQERGVAWAKSDVPIITKMEWFYALRKVIWSFLREYYLRVGITPEETFELSERISDALDNFIIQFNVVFTKYRDDVLKSKQAIIDELTVPLIPIFSQIAVLPLVGTLDDSRMNKIEERMLNEIEQRNIQKVYIDLSAASIPSPETFQKVLRMIDGIKLLGCQVVVTGIRAKLVKTILDLDKSVIGKLVVESTLQQALLKETAIGKALSQETQGEIGTE